MWTLCPRGVWLLIKWHKYECLSTFDMKRRIKGYSFNTVHRQLGVTVLRNNENEIFIRDREVDYHIFLLIECIYRDWNVFMYKHCAINIILSNFVFISYFHIYSHMVLSISKWNI